jgi:hypothetical protein
VLTFFAHNLFDISESINRWSLDACKIEGDRITFTTSLPSALRATNLNDMKWALNKAATLTNDDWKEIVNGEYFPSALHEVTEPADVD